MGEDLMQHLINNGSTANDAYTQEQGETIDKEEEEVKEEEGGEEEEKEPVVATGPATTVKGKMAAMAKKGGGIRGPK
jgi:hypothetical protein